MKAIVRDEYGNSDVLALEEIERPTPAEDEVVVRVRASSLNRADHYRLLGIPAPIRFVSGLFKPKTRGFGLDFAGDVEQVGSRVTDVAVGDAVYGEQSFGSTWAEYAAIPASLVAPKPCNLSYEQAAAMPLSGVTALLGLRDDGAVQPGQTVLINGATGAVGPLAVQIAKALGAEVTAVCSARNVEFVTSLGAGRVIPYETEDFTACGQQFDLLFDVVGDRSLSTRRRVLKPNGTLVLVGGPEGRWLGPIVPLFATAAAAPFVSQHVKVLSWEPSRDHLLALTELIEAADLRPTIDRTFALAEAGDAMRYLAEGRPPTKVVVSV